MLTGADAKRAMELENQLGELSRTDQLAEAQDVARQILELRQRVQGAEHWQTADARRAVDDLKRLERLPAEARAQLREAEALYLRWSQLWNAGKYAEGLPLARQVVAIDRKSLGEEHTATLTGFDSVAHTLAAQGKHAEAEQLFRHTLSLRRQLLGKDHPDTAQGYNHVALCLHGQAKYAEAEPLCRQALTIDRKVLGEEHRATAKSYNILALCLYAQGKHAEAELLYRRALTIDRKVLGEDHSDTADVYNNLAGNLNAQGKYAEAEPLYRRALALRRKLLGEEHPYTAQSYNNVAFNLDAQGKYTEAEPLFRRALALCRKVLGEEHPHTASTYNNLAFNLNAQGKYAEAEPLCRRALALRRRLQGEEHAATAQSYNNVAVTLQAQGKHAEAEALYRHALTIYCKLLGEEHPQTALSYNNLAATLYAQGKFAEAEKLYRRALALRRRLLGDEHPATTLSYHHLAFTLHAQGQYTEAETVWRAAAHGYEAARLRVDFGGLERAVFAGERSPLLALAACRARTGDAVAAWQSAEANLARGLLDDLSARLARPLTESERQREQELGGRLQRLDKQIAALVPRGKSSDAHRQQTEKLQDQRGALLAELSRFESDLAHRYGPAAGQVYELARIQAQLPADAALLSWIDLKGLPLATDPDGEHWACLVRQRGAPVWVRLRGSGPKGTWSSEDDNLPAPVRALLIEQPTKFTANWSEVTGRLYRQRLAPVAEHLCKRDDLPAVRHLIILPSSWLAGVPVEALVEARTDKQPAYTVSYAPSGTMLAWLHEKRQKTSAKEKQAGPTRILAVGDPVFAGSGEAGTSIPSLPATRREVEAIARLFDRPVQLLGSQASEQRLEELAASGRLKEYAYLHMATHGVLDPQVAMHSALILAQDNLPDPLERVLAGKKAYDGRLTAEQILRTWKLDADLVTLSACQTELGKYQGGEGYLGFAQALFLAGGRGLVLSLWKVDDNATALLMSRFYQNLLGKRPGLDQPMGKALALAEAKAWLRGLSSEEVNQHIAQLPRGAEVERPSAPVPAAVHPYAHPYYWAAFILVGDPN
jgi:CHAT domain-containing protein/Tfp pilus assembly protein PilF